MIIDIIRIKLRIFELFNEIFLLLQVFFVNESVIRKFNVAIRKTYYQWQQKTPWEAAAKRTRSGVQKAAGSGHKKSKP